MNVLLDSDALLWWLQDDARLPASAGALIDDPSVRVHVSAASLWELVARSAAGRLRIDDGPSALLVDALDDAGFRVLPIERRHVLAMSELSAFHAAPFDLMLVAQAIVEGFELVTGNRELGRYPVRTVW